jgi:hypothetical protein
MKELIERLKCKIGLHDWGAETRRPVAMAGAQLVVQLRSKCSKCSKERVGHDYV